MKKTVMIAGATGFLGRNLIASVPSNLELLPNPPRYGMARTADYIIHAAGYAAPSIFTKQPIETIQVNTETVIRLIRHLNPGGTFLYCSSCEVYKGLLHPAIEDEIGTTTPLHPRACYIEGKKCGETIVNAYRSQGINALSARIALAYGPGTKKHDARVLNQFIEKALTTGRIDLVDDGSVEVDYCYIDDMIDMLWNVLLHGTQPVYNLGGKSRITIANLAHLISAQTGARVTIPDGPTSVPQGRLNLTRYYEEFQWPNYISLEEGLHRTIEYQKELYGCETASGD